MIRTSFSKKVPIKNGVIIKGSNYCGNISLLSKANKSLYLLMGYITSNNMDYLIQNFNLNVYNTLGAELYKIRMDPIKCPDFEQVRTFFKIALEMLYMYVSLYNKLGNCEIIQEQLNEKDKILNDIQLLKDRIKMLSKQVNLFEETTIEMPEVQIQLEYIIYIQKYGYPETGAFDTDLLEAIRENM